jgi:hypothetical protein
VGKEVGLPLENLGNRNGVEDTVNTSVDQGNHLVDGHGRVLLLLEELGKTLTTGKSLLGGSIQIGTELGESGDLTVLSQEELQGTSNLLHGLDLGSGTDTGHGETDVNGGSDTLVEEFGLQENLCDMSVFGLEKWSLHTDQSGVEHTWPSVMEMTLVGM